MRVFVEWIISFPLPIYASRKMRVGEDRKMGENWKMMKKEIEKMERWWR